MLKVKINRHSYNQAVVKYTIQTGINTYPHSQTVKDFENECSLNIACSFRGYHLCNILDKKKFLLSSIKYGLAIESD